MTKIDVVQIDSNVPIPVRTPLLSLKVGQSFVFPEVKRPSVSTYASAIKKREGKEFTIKKISDGECRIWRVK